MPPPLLVAKVGGSLLDWSGLPGALTAFLDRHRDRRLVLVVGGGETVDAIRSLDQIHSLGEHASHHLAIRAMDVTAHCLAAIVPGLVVVEAIADLPPVWSGPPIPVFAPRRFLDREDRDAADPLPHSWAVTSDSIAARLAVRLGADSLTLLKSTSPPTPIDRAGAAALGLVDPTFPAVSRPLARVSLLNLRDDRLPEAILP
jgi:aspartokinase-like uncharacterized kinase